MTGVQTCALPIFSPNEAYEKAIGVYGRYTKEQGAVKHIDPRTDKEVE